MGNSALLLGVVLLLLAVAKLIAPVAAREPCSRFCFVYDLLAHFFSAQFTNAVSGIMWLALAVLFLVGGWRARKKVIS